MYKLRTIDVWDTLLRRDCHPECIKLATAQHLFLGWVKELKPEFSNDWLLYKARLEAELKLASLAKAGGKDDEYEISQVLPRWIESVFAGTIPPGLSAHLAEYEISIEITRSYADPGISLFLDSTYADMTLFLSDFYMSAEMLGRLLTSKGLDKIVSNGISSCDVGYNKRSGQIFRYVHELYSITADQHLHIGDNEWSDVATPRALGVHALHYLPESAHTERLARERLFSSREALFDHIRTECFAIFQKPADELPARQAAALSLGVQAAPLFIGFTLWIAEQAILHNLDRMYFFTREGEFFHKIYSALFPQSSLCGHSLPPSKILEVSRLSTFTPSMMNPSIREMTRIWSLYKVQSISGLFSTLGLDIMKFSAILNALGLKETDVISDPENSPELHLLFETPAFAEAVKNASTTQADLLRSYLSQSGMKKGEKIGVIDVGWRGTIQDNIAMVMPDTYFHGMYLGLRRFINAQPANVTKKAYGLDESISNENSLIFSCLSAMEMLCSSPYGSVVGYTVENGQTTPLRHVNLEESASHSEFAEYFQNGVMLATQHWQSYLERYVISSDELHAMALHIWATLCKTPNKDMVDVFLHTPEHDIFGYGGIFKRSNYPTLSTILLSPILTSRRRELIAFIRWIQWSEAIKNAKDIGPLHRTLLLLAFRTAHLIKYVKFTVRRKK